VKAQCSCDAKKELGMKYHFLGFNGLRDEASLGFSFKNEKKPEYLHSGKL